MTAISFPPLTFWVSHLTAPVKPTGTEMRSEREQLIKSSSSRASESQFCLPSAMISFYLKVMSYGTFASGNAISSISMFHLPHKQGQVILASSYHCNQSNWLPRQRRKGKGSGWFLWITTQRKKIDSCIILTHNILFLFTHQQIWALLANTGLQKEPSFSWNARGGSTPTQGRKQPGYGKEKVQLPGSRPQSCQTGWPIPTPSPILLSSKKPLLHTIFKVIGNRSPGRFRLTPLMT